MIAVGVDTHKHEHLARALDGLGQLLGGLTVDASLAGYTQLVQWLRTLGEMFSLGSRAPAATAPGSASTSSPKGLLSWRSSVPAVRTAEEGSPTRSTR